MKLTRMVCMGALVAALCGCQSMPPIHTVASVDIERFMGDWYVIACIPTFIETDAYNAVESYRLASDGTIATTFRFNQGGFDGPLKVYRPTGFIRDTASNAVWGMQFIWPFKAEFRIIYLSEDYGQTIIGRTQRDYVWIMARRPTMSDADYARLLRFIEEQGYSTEKMRRVPHSPAPTS